MRFFSGVTAREARMKAAICISSAFSAMPGWRNHVFCEVYGPEAKRRYG
jgi:hypothetical protein